MGRPTIKRKICKYDYLFDFVIIDNNSEFTVEMTLDEFFCLKLIDFGRASQEECAGELKISRTLVTKIYAQARKKLADAIFNHKNLKIIKGPTYLCNNAEICEKVNCFIKKTFFHTV